VCAPTQPPQARKPCVTLRILTTHPKDHHPFWLQRTEILPGWLDEVARTGDRPMSLGASLTWGWRLFRASRRVDAVVTGFERAWWVFALLQRLMRTRYRVPHVMVYASFVLPEHRALRAIKRLYYRHVLDRLVLRSVSRIVVYSRYQIDLFARTLGIPPERFVCVPYHTTLYDVRCEERDGGYIFSGGDFTRDYVSLIEATRELAYPVIIAARFRHYFAGVHLPPNVRILTATRQEFFALMAGARLVVLPLKGGLLHSGGQQTYLNAMALGKPVIVADDCGADEYITHAVNGMVLAPGDRAGLRQAINMLMEDHKLAWSLGERARNAAKAYSPEHFLERILGVVQECVHASDRRVP
jgi:glycosyltransferase involved in cell wall biosynthesis